MSNIEEDRRVCSPRTDLGCRWLCVPHDRQSRKPGARTQPGQAHCQCHMSHPSLPSTPEPGHPGGAEDEVNGLGSTWPRGPALPALYNFTQTGHLVTRSRGTESHHPLSCSACCMKSNRANHFSCCSIKCHRTKYTADITCCSEEGPSGPPITVT